MEWIIGIVLIGAVVIFFGMYNSLIARRNQVDQAFASIDVMLKRRHDLIPNLIASVQGAMRHERELLTELTELRTRAISGDAGDRVDTENRITDVIGRLVVAVENYPDLKANQNFCNYRHHSTKPKSRSRRHGAPTMPASPPTIPPSRACPPT